MANIKERLNAIAADLARYVTNADPRKDTGQDAISITFLGKEPGCWVSSQ